MLGRGRSIRHNDALVKVSVDENPWRARLRRTLAKPLAFVAVGALITSLAVATIKPTSDSGLEADARGELSAISQQIVFRDEIAQLADPLFSLSLPTLLSRAAAHPRAEPESRSREIVVRKGETLSHILRREGYYSTELWRAVQESPDARPLYQLIPGQRLSIRTDAAGDLQELLHRISPYETLKLTRAVEGFAVTREQRAVDIRLAYVNGGIERSLFEDGQEAGLSDPLILSLAEIFGWDIDFALDLRPGDSFSVIYEEKFWQGQKVADGEILAAEFINQGKTYRAIAFRDEDGGLRYYTPSGMSLKRAFLRTPVQFSRITSRFTNARYHPILKTWRAHKGVDYAAPTGTPVRATASGKIVHLGGKGGYGKTIIIEHGGAYRTLYAHLSRYHRGLREGARVEQGQTIGYVGSTGMATGPHLHYEFQVHGEHRNPLTFKFPAADPIAAKYRAEFGRAASSLMAQLDLISRGAVALNDATE